MKGEGAPPRADVSDSERRKFAVGQRRRGQTRKKNVLENLLRASRDGGVHAVADNTIHEVAVLPDSRPGFRPRSFLHLPRCLHCHRRAQSFHLELPEALQIQNERENEKKIKT